MNTRDIIQNNLNIIYTADKGYRITAIDGSREMCKIASENIGQKVICQEFKDLNEDNLFDLIWTCASIIHVPLF